MVICVLYYSPFSGEKSSITCKLIQINNLIIYQNATYILHEYVKFEYAEEKV